MIRRMGVDEQASPTPIPSREPPARQEHMP